MTNEIKLITKAVEGGFGNLIKMGYVDKEYLRPDDDYGYANGQDVYLWQYNKKYPQNSNAEVECLGTWEQIILSNGDTVADNFCMALFKNNSVCPLCGEHIGISDYCTKHDIPIEHYIPLHQYKLHQLVDSKDRDKTIADWIGELGL